MGILKKLLPFTGLIIFLLIIWKGINLESAFTVFSRVNVYYLFPAFFFTFAIIFFKVTRLFKILRENNIEITFINLLEIYANTNLLSQVTNLLFSETTAALATMHNQNSKTRVANIYLLCNVTDFAVIMMLCLISFAVNYKYVMNLLCFKMHENFGYLIWLLLFIVLLLFICLFFYKKFILLLKRIFFDIKELFINSLKTLKIMTFLVYMSYLLACFFDAKTFNIEINFFYLVFVYTLASLITVIPISVNGLGTREALIIFLLHFKHIENERAFALSIFAFILAPVTVFLIFYLFVLFKKRLLNCQ